MFNTPSDPYLTVAFWAGVVSVALTLLVAVLVVGLRVQLRRRQRRWDRFVARWRPVLMAAMVEPAPGPMPRLAPGQALLFMRLWAYMHESVRGESARRLNEAARLLRVDAAARKLLRRGSRSDKLLAILSVGHLRDAQAWDDLVALAHHPDGLVSVHAARALIQIDALQGVQRLMPLIVSRDDWDVTRVAGFLGTAREAFWLLLAKGILQMPPDRLMRALRLGDALRLKLPPATVRYLLGESQPAEVTAEALRMADHPELGTDVRRCLAHPDRRVRQQAARQLGVIGGPADVPRLAGLLQDKEWPVRLAAAQALASMPFVDQAQLRALQAQDGAAAQIMTHVLAERGAA